MVHKEVNGKKIRVEFVILFILLSVFFVFALVFLTAQKKEVTKIAPKSTQDAFPLPTGAQYFNVTYGDEENNKPKISYILVDPLNAPLGSMQTISFKATSPYPIVQIASVLFTDKNKINLSFSLVEGTTTDGVWTATWTVNDTLLKRYKILFHLVNKADVRDDEITFR